MAIDITILVILLISCLLGARKGFAATITSLFGWFVSTVCGLVFFDTVKKFIEANTPIDEFFNGIILERLVLAATGIGTGTKPEGSLSYDTIPDLFGNFFTSINPQLADGFNAAAENAVSKMLEGTAQSITSILMSVISFLILVLGIKLVSRLILMLFSKQNNKGLTGFVDGLAGFAFGAVRGLFLIFIFLGLLVPILTLINPDFSQLAMDDFSKSKAGDFLYQHNLMLMVLKGLFTGH